MEVLQKQHATITGRPIVLLPGFCSPAKVLGPLARRLERRLQRPTRIQSYGPAWGDVRDLAERVYDVLERSCEPSDPSCAPGGIDVVGHSMGGIVGTYLLKCLDHGRRIRRVVSLGSPHGGLASARIGHLLPGPIGCTLRQLARGSPLLDRLARMPLPETCELVSIVGLDDAIVPCSAARLPLSPGQYTLALPGVDHLGLVFSKRGFDALTDFFGPGDPQTRPACDDPTLCAA